MSVRPAFLVAAALLIAPGHAGADDLDVSASLSQNVVAVGTETVLSVTIQGKFRKSGEPELPPLDDFYVYDSGTSQNFSIINGDINSSVTFRYTLVPKAEGVFEIGPIRFVYKDKEYKAQPLRLEVTKASTSIPSARPLSRQPSKPPSGEDRRDQSIFITSTVDRDTVYVNQQVTWTLGYYTDGRVNLMRSPNYTPPEAEGFWVEDLPPQNKYYTQLYDRQYLVNEIKRGYFPTGPGLYEIGPAKVDVVIDDLSSRSFDDFFSRAFRSRGFGKSRALMTESIKIAVLPLPTAGRPDNFSGVVAEALELSMAADKQVAQVGEPINVTVEIDGKGNLKTIGAPPFTDLDGFKVYDSGSATDVFKKDYIVTGRKKFDYVLIPQESGKLTIPAVEMPYFDPAKRRYELARSHAIHLDVKPGAKEKGSKIIYAGGGDDFEVISQDIRYIHSVPPVVFTAPRRLYESKAYLALHALPLFAVVFSLVFERRRRRLREDEGFARSSRALREAQKRLHGGRDHFRNGRIEEGIAAVSSALGGYLADKMNTSAAGITVGKIDEFLVGRRVDEGPREEVRAALDTCDRARFASASMQGDEGMAMVDKVRKLLHDLERKYLG